MWDDDQIDAAIDAAARGLTAGDPGPEFRVRVMERIERAPKFSLAWRPVVVGVAVVAIVAIAVIWRPANNNQPPQTQEVRLKADTTYVKPEAATAEVRLPPAPKSGSGVHAPEVRLKPDATYEIELLTTAPLNLEPIAVPALDADESLRIDPLPSAPSIAVAPLAAEPEGDRR